MLHLQCAYPTNLSTHHGRVIFRTSSSLQSMPRNKHQHILFKNQLNCHHSITHHSYFHHHLTQILHHNSHTTNPITLFKPPQLMILPSIPLILEPCPLHLTLYAHQSPSPNPVHSDYLYFTSLPTPQCTNQASCHISCYAFQDEKFPMF